MNCIFRSARWTLRCKNTYYPTGNVSQVQLTGKLLALFFFSREFRPVFVLLENVVRGEWLDVVLKQCEREGNNCIALQKSQTFISQNYYVGWNHSSKVEYLSPKYRIPGDCLSQIIFTSLVFPELGIHKAREEMRSGKSYKTLAFWVCLLK